MVATMIGEGLDQLRILFERGSLAGMTDGDLIRRFTHGRDADAFAALVARHGPMVLAVCRSVALDPADAEDAFQATFLVLARRASSLHGKGSLGGWLHGVARRIAWRGRQTASRRRDRERAIDDPDHLASSHYEDAVGERSADLHEEIARLPAAMRRALVLCCLEGKTQPDAARELGCGEATIRRRLSAAKDRLRRRLEARDSLGAFLALDVLRLPAVPAGWVAEAVRAALATGPARPASAVLAAWALGRLALARLGSGLAAIVLIAGLGAGGWVVAALSNGQNLDAPPSGSLASPPSPPPGEAAPRRELPEWVHTSSDSGLERWINLIDGQIFARKADEDGVVHLIHSDPSSNVVLRYDTQSKKAVRRRLTARPEGVPAPSDAIYRLLPKVAFPQPEPLTPYIAPEQAGEGGRTFANRTPENLDGRESIRIDDYRRDPANPREAILISRTWVDPRSRLVIRTQTPLEPDEKKQSGRDFSTQDYAYPEQGPRDLVDLGMPRNTPRVGEIRTHVPKLPEAVDRALWGASHAIAGVPRDLRVVEIDGTILKLQYWSASEPFLGAWARGVATGDYGGLYKATLPREFLARRGGLSVLPDELRQALEADPSGPLPGDDLARIFPLGRANTLRLCDGFRDIQLMRFVSTQGPAKGSTLEVGRQIASLPEPIERQWAHAWADRSKLQVRQADDKSREGIIQLREETDEVAHDWDIDPERSYAIIRQATYRKRDRAWRLSEEAKATRFERLPNGPWYVSTWDVRTITRRTDGPGSGPDVETRSTRRLAISPVDSGAFPAGIFDGDRLLEEAMKEGAIAYFGARAKDHP